MTVTFRIEGVQVDTSNGVSRYAFPADLTVLAGQTGVGKTTLLELVKFGLGGDGRLAPVARRHVIDVHVSIRIGDSRLQLSRGIDAVRQKTVRVVDLITGERLRDHSVGGEAPTVSDLLLTAMGLETGLHAAARGGRSTRAGAQITFNDVFRFMYVPQAEMNRDIAWSQQGYYAPKRKAVFELLLGLTSPGLLQMRSEFNTLKSDLDEAEREASTVQHFLASSGMTSRVDAEARQAQAQQDEAAARAAFVELQGELAQAVDRESQVLRDMLADGERSLAEANQLAIELRRQRDEYSAERKRVSLDLDRLARLASAGERLASIEFAVCPRCTQSLTQREVPAGACRVCLQPDVVAELPAQGQYESDQLTSQLHEIDEQLRVIRAQHEKTDRTIANRTDLVRSLTTQLDLRTASRVTPRLQVFADAATRLERSRADQDSLEMVLRQWDRVEDLVNHAESISTRRARLASDIQTIESNLARRRVELFSELDAEFQTTVTDFGIPSVETASISPETYLPLLNGQPFDEASSGGGIITATQVAYWISLVTVAARRRDTRLPAFLLLDSPRLALNTAEDIAAQMYRRFVTQVAVTPGRLQFIVADNELPSEYGRDFNEMTFTYESPTVSSIPHPGPANVRTLDGQGAFEANE